MKKNIAIVTGGSSGLGREFVRLLLYESYKVFLRHYSRALNIELKGKGI